MLDALGRAQIVGIGEAAGGTYADALPKTLLVLALVHQVAIDTPNFEASRTGAEQLDAFLRSDRSDTTAVVREADCRGWTRRMPRHMGIMRREDSGSSRSHSMTLIGRRSEAVGRGCRQPRLGHWGTLAASREHCPDLAETGPHAPSIANLMMTGRRDGSSLPSRRRSSTSPTL
jgi:hypothetical protein